MNLDAVEAGRFNCVACRGGKGVNDAGDLSSVERAWFRGIDEAGHAVLDEHGLCLGRNSRRSDRLAAFGLQVDVRHAAHVPQLHYDLAAVSMHRVGHFLPCAQLLGAVEARNVGVALALLADRSGFGDEQASAGTLRVVGRGDGGWNGVGRAIARQRRHHDAVGEVQVTGLYGVEKSMHRDHGLSWTKKALRLAPREQTC